MGWYFPLGVGQGAGGGNGTRRKLHIFIEISGKQNFLGFFLPFSAISKGRLHVLYVGMQK